MLEIRTDGASLLIRVRAQPKARRDAVTGLHAGALRVQVTEPPEKGKANAAVAAAVAAWLGLPKSSVSVVQGTSSRDKVIRITGSTEDAVRAAASRLSSEG